MTDLDLRGLPSDDELRGLPADIAERRRLGHDRRDEVWEGVYTLVPPGAHPWHGRVDAELARLLAPHADRAGLLALTQCNVGVPLDYRCPDGAYVRTPPGTVFLPQVAVAVEVLSPGDRTFAKLAFYAVRAEELLVADPVGRTVRCWRGEVEQDRSAVLDVAMAELTAALPWPVA